MKILVGYDGSDGGRDALELTRLLAEATGAEVMVVTVLPYGPLPIPYEILEEEEAERARPLFDEARERLGELEVESRAFGGGSPAGVINDLAEREGVDTIVVGSPAGRRSSSTPSRRPRPWSPGRRATRRRRRPRRDRS